MSTPVTPRRLGESVQYTLGPGRFEAVVVGRCKPIGEQWLYDVRLTSTRMIIPHVTEGALS